jgi:hypothetical protein
LDTFSTYFGHDLDTISGSPKVVPIRRSASLGQQWRICHTDNLFFFFHAVAKLPLVFCLRPWYHIDSGNKATAKETKMDKKLEQLAVAIMVMDYLRNGGTITKCPPVLAYGAETNPISKTQLAAERRNWQA